MRIPVKNFLIFFSPGFFPGILGCSFFNLFAYDYLDSLETFDYPYWGPPRVTPKIATDEAVMLIGGKHCIGRQCPEHYRRRQVDGKNVHSSPEKEFTFQTVDTTIKFFTRYGFCRQYKAKADTFTLNVPMMPDAATSVGAVATPDGRVVICGGVSTKLQAGGRLEALNSTDCWYWIHSSYEVRRLEFYSKIPYKWLGPFTPKQMQLVEFEQPVNVKDASEYYKEMREREKERLKPKINEYEFPFDKTEAPPDEAEGVASGGKDGKKKKAKRAGTTTEPKLEKGAVGGGRAERVGEDYQDEGVSLEQLHEENKDIIQRMEFHRILIIPWPPYTDAFKKDRFNRMALKGGDVIVGRMKITAYGPRFYWTKHKLFDMPMGYGGCFVVEKLYSGDIRVHTFGGREVYVDPRLRDMGWTQNPHHLTKYPRYFDIGLEKSINTSRTDAMANSSGEIYFLDELAQVTRPYCGTLEPAGPAYMMKRKAMEEKYVSLEQDRIFHTCHILPVQHYFETKDQRWRNDVVLIGGGTATFFDRQRILEANYDYTPIYRAVARYDLRPDPNDMGDCTVPVMDGKGRWVPEDKVRFKQVPDRCSTCSILALTQTFGYGLNIPRTRHASEIIKTTNPFTHETEHFLFIFGGYSDSYGGVLDTVESVPIGDQEKHPKNFYIYDADPDKREFFFRLPWPLMDVATVKIPISWLPAECYDQYQRRRRRHQELKSHN